MPDTKPELPVYVKAASKRLEKTSAIFSACGGVFFIHILPALFIICADPVLYVTAKMPACNGIYTSI